MYDPANEHAFEATPLACAACAAGARSMRKLDDVDGVTTFVDRRR